MKIVPDKFYNNKTKDYLYRVILCYGEMFRITLNKFFKVAVGIGDLILERNGILLDNHLFILVNIDKTPDFKDLLETIKMHSSYETDYRFDLKGQYHMIVIKVPNEHLSSLEHFKKSHYSKMYSKKNIREYFGDLKDKRIEHVLTNNSEYKPEFCKLIMKEFAMKEKDVHPNALEGELDFPIKEREEYFNFDIVGE